MHENIDARITELKEIALQILNAISDKLFIYRCEAVGYLEVIAYQDLKEHAKYYNRPIAEAYEMQIIYVLNNLRNWHGGDAKQYKALLKEYLAYFQGKSNTGKLSENVNPLWQAIRGIGD